MTYPFAGEIKMTKVIKDGKEVIEWEPVNMTYHADGNVGIGTPISMTDGLGITPGNGGEFVFTKPATEWARVDKDLNVTHLDMDLCRNGEQNEYTALALAIWDAAKKDWQGLTDEEVHQGFCHVEYETPNDWNTDPDDWCQQFARYLEAKLKEKNEKN